MHKYRKKPVEIEAIQWTGDNRDEIWESYGPNSRRIYASFNRRLYY